MTILKCAEDTKSRLIEAQKKLESLMDNDELSFGKQLQAAYKYAEISVALFKLESETEVYRQSLDKRKKK